MACCADGAEQATGRVDRQPEESTVAEASGLRALAALPLWRRWTLASLLARLPTSMTLLALVLAGEEATGSAATGALLAGAATFTAGFAAPWRGARLDRRELRGGLQRACLGGAAVLLLEAAALAAGAPIAVLFVLAVVQGVALAAVSGGFRALLVAVVPARELPRANAIEAVFVEVAFVSGPAVAGVLALLTGATGVLAAMGLALLAAAAVTGGLPRVPPSATALDAAVWRYPAVVPVYAIALALGATLGIVESALPVRVTDFGLDPAVAGPLAALLALGSGVGGVAASSRLHSTQRADVLAQWFALAFAVLLVPLALAPSPVWLGLALLLSGVPIAPLNALGALVLQEALPAGRRAQGFAIFVAAILVGAGIGNAVTGGLLGTLGARGLLGASAAVPLSVAAFLVVARARGARRVRAEATSGR